MKKLVFSVLVIALMLSVGLLMRPAFAGVCGQNEQVRLGPVPVDGSVEGVRFNYVNTSRKMAKVTARFYSDNNILLDTQTATIEPGKGQTISFDGVDGESHDHVFVLADVGFEDPILAFESPIVGFEVPVFLTSLETFDDSGRTGIWGTDGTSIWGTDGTSIVSSSPGAREGVSKRSLTTIAFPPITVAPGEYVQLAVTNASESSEGNVYLQFVDIESGETVGDDENIFCKPVIPCEGVKDVCFVCEPQPVPTGEGLEIRFYNPADDSEPMTVVPIVKDFEVPVFSESFEVPVFLKGFEVPVFMPTMTLRSSDSGQVKIFSGAAGLLTPSSCQR